MFSDVESDFATILLLKLFKYKSGIYLGKEKQNVLIESVFIIRISIFIIFIITKAAVSLKGEKILQLVFCFYSLGLFKKKYRKIQRKPSVTKTKKEVFLSFAVH